jgi:hypothetical protein
VTEPGAKAGLAAAVAPAIRRLRRLNRNAFSCALVKPSLAKPSLTKPSADRSVVSLLMTVVLSSRTFDAGLSLAKPDQFTFSR